MCMTPDKYPLVGLQILTIATLSHVKTLIIITNNGYVCGQRVILLYPILHSPGDFPRAWALLLEYIESAALCHNAEVSLAALKSFQEILRINRDSKDSGKDEWKMLFEKKGAKELDAPKEETIARGE